MESAVLTAPTSVGIAFALDEDLAVADVIARLDPQAREEALRDLDSETLLYDFDFWGRPSQLYAYRSPNHIIAMLFGRGGGKTHTGCKWVHDKAMANPGCRIGLVARTVADVRGTVVLGESGIMAVAPPSEQPHYVPNNRELTWPNGTIATTFSAEVPDQIRGPQFHFSFAEELATWPVKPPPGSIANAWDNLKIATRLGEHPQIFVATTPRRVPMVVELLNGAHADPGAYTVVRGSTRANRHLSPAYLDVVTGMYEGTSLARQELEGELLGDLTGALLTSAVLDAGRLDRAAYEIFDPMELPIRVIGVDPSVAEKPRDECGIVAVASTFHRQMFRRHTYVLGDFSVHGSPKKWTQRVVEAARQYRAYVVAEDNQGGEMVRMVIQAADPEVPVVLVRSQSSKSVRAEPIVMAAEQGRVRHVDFFGELESQLTSWVPDESNYSPDRLDAWVIANAAALSHRPKGMGGKITTVTNQAAIEARPIHQRQIAGTVSNRRHPAYRPRAKLFFRR
jgi:phage terminase large subunit-like protein